MRLPVIGLNVFKGYTAQPAFFFTPNILSVKISDCTGRVFSEKIVDLRSIDGKVNVFEMRHIYDETVPLILLSNCFYIFPE
jgi:hypothetical protein